MPLVDTTTLVQGEKTPLDGQIYNGLDCCLTFEIFEELHDVMQGDGNRAENLLYNFSRALQAPALEMMLRGWKVDEIERQEGAKALREEIAVLQEQLNEFAMAVWSYGLNARSPKQLHTFFYEKMKLPVVVTYQKGVRKESLNRESLEKLADYLHARPIVALILAIRETAKRLEVLETEIDPDGRMRTSYNIAGTETGRWSSSANATGTGTNLQNITPSLRRMFIADSGWKLCGIDLEQAESREVGLLLGTLFNEWAYLDACEGGDLHTTVARMIWPELPWNGDGGKKDREVAERPFYRHFSYRDMAKRGGHGSNYLGTPFTMAKHLKVPTRLMEVFQERYFDAFPLPKWHRYVAQELQTKQVIFTPFGNSRHFYGRPNDDATLREAIAYGPQSATALRNNLALWRIWKYMGKRVQVLGQVHDFNCFQFREEEDEAEVVKEALRLTSTPITLPNGHIFDVPGEAKTGWNWGYYSEKNPEGMKKFNSALGDSRVHANGKDRVL